MALRPKSMAYRSLSDHSICRDEPQRNGNFWDTGRRAMPDYILNALFVTAGLMLIWELGSVLPRAQNAAFRALLHAVMGLAALLIANAVGGMFGLGIGLNALTLPTAAGLGVPGTALLWALRYLL